MAEEKKVPAKGAKKGNFWVRKFGAIGKFFRDTKGEFKKIVWPTFPSVMKNTGVTLAMCALTAVIIIVVDLGLGQLVNLLLNL